MNARKIGATLVALGLTLGLIGAGVSASYTDNGSASEIIRVGTFGCEISSTAPQAVVVNQANPALHTVTLPLVEIKSSAAGSVALPFAIKSVGSIGTTVSVTMTVPPAPFTSVLVAPVADVYLTTNQSHDYAGGLQWPMLVNADLEKAATITYTATCAEGQPPAPDPTQVTPAAPTAINESCDGGTVLPGGVIIPSVTGVVYGINGDTVAAGTHPRAAGNFTVNAMPAQDPNVPGGYVLTGTTRWDLSIVPATCVVPPQVEYVGVNNLDSTVVTSPTPLPPGVAGCWASSVGNVCQVAYPAGTQPGDLVVAITQNRNERSGTPVASTPTGWVKQGPSIWSGTCSGTHGCTVSATFSTVAGTETVTPVWTSTEAILLVVYRHASVGAVAGVLSNAIPPLTLQDTSGTSWVAGLVTKASPALTVAITPPMTARSNPTDRYIAAFDTAAGVSSWAGHNVSVGMHGFAVELRATP